MDIPTRKQLAKLAEGICCELGVCKGEYSEAILQGSNCELLYSIDRWAGDRGHNNKQYMQAMSRLHPYGGRNMVLRMSFEEACERFPNGFFDFIYIDGYAHTGQDGGKTLEQWWPLLKSGGIFAGHDYCPKWAATMKAVDSFVSHRGLKLYTTQKDRYPSWFVFKP